MKIFKRLEFWVMLVLFAVGIGIIVFAIYYTKNSREKINNYIETSAYVIDYAEKWDEDGTLYSEIVEYYVNGEMYTAQNSMSSSSPKRIGSEMEIAFNPDNPRDCIFVGSEKLLYIFLFVFGGFATLFGVVLAVHLKKTLELKNL